MLHEVRVSPQPEGLELPCEVRVVPCEQGGDSARAGNGGPRGPQLWEQPCRTPDKLCSGLGVGVDPKV